MTTRTVAIGSPSAFMRGLPRSFVQAVRSGRSRDDLRAWWQAPPRELDARHHGARCQSTETQSSSVARPRAPTRYSRVWWRSLSATSTPRSSPAMDGVVQRIGVSSGSAYAPVVQASERWCTLVAVCLTGRCPLADQRFTRCGCGPINANEAVAERYGCRVIERSSWTQFCCPPTSRRLGSTVVALRYPLSAVGRRRAIVSRKTGWHPRRLSRVTPTLA